MNGQPGSGGLLADLALAMGGALAQFAGGLVGLEDSRQGVGVHRLLDADMLQGIAAPFDRWPHRPDRRAIVSVWTLTYFEAMLPPLLSANILLDRAPRMDLGDVGFVIAPDQRIAALKVVVEHQPLIGLAAGHRFHGLVAGHLTPFIEHVALRGGVTQRVLWSNAGHIFEVFLTMIEGIAARRAGLQEARSLLAAPTLPWGGQNPLHRPVHYVDGKRIRRVCCLRLLMPEWGICAICPAKPRPRAT